MKEEKRKKLVLVDGSSYLFRAFHGLPPLISNGHPTGAIYGVLNMLRKLILDENPDLIGVIFDAKGKTFRNDIYTEYKANRPPMPDDLRMQIEPLHEIIKAQGLPLVIVDKVEADDVIGTLAKQAAEQGFQVLVSTGDKDMAQLVNEHVTLINTMNNVLMDEDMVLEKFQVKPDQIIDYLALMGDTSDNIPGVPKVGPKTASKWLNEYDSLQNVMDNAENFKGKVGENLRASLDFLPMSYELATIKLDVELDFEIKDLKLKDIDAKVLSDFYQQFEFKRWLDELESEGFEIEPAEPAPETEYEVILDQPSFDSWLQKISSVELFAIDTETTSINYMDAEIVGLSLCVEENKACYIPLSHNYSGAPEQLNRQQVLQALKPVLENPEIGKVGQNIKYEHHIFKKYDIDLKGMQHDTMLQSYVLNSTATRHNMDDLSEFYLNRKTIYFEDVAGKGAKQVTFDQVDLELAVPYASEDADVTLQLHQALFDQLQKDEALLNVYRDIEMPLIPVLARIEQNGVCLDQGLLEKQAQEVDELLDNIQANIFELAGENFNLSSPKQIQVILFEKLELPVIRKTPKGQPSTAEDVLEELARDHDIPRLLLEHRSLNKLKTTYIDKLPQQVNLHTGRIHTSYHQAVASTGRLSSSNPNLQNIPVRSEQGRRIRDAFIAPEGFKIMALDYSQIELRIMAHLSADESLLNAFAQGLDVHRATAAEVFAVSNELVTIDQRRAAKAINFGLIYGMSAFGLGKQLNIGRNEAQKYVDLYFERYPGVKTYMDETREKAHETGYVETVFGRRLYLPELKSRNAQRRHYAERTAINAPMQGTAADIIKIAMIKVDQWLSSEGDQARMIMQVHDELVFEIKQQDLDYYREKLCTLMTSAADLSVSLEVDAGVGDSWNEAH
ncbi:MAG: DNA polymerase I [Gammaproteobacteria bacterium]|jgi:DNA polymerase-1|nr:DNA polymerase I [Gammaproteobacteria bacterium]MBT3722391.1 DNA polymerase I [Gammaproteobacteria bacterium]MBT4075299.1 DNA polymerase I [Gammaproteobacteria bacterium]MBT4861241.1 DNA polymerase I [Gammaproteobacteria bacterium]MBT6456342.1 DNA polymerase I [Gammaproteobacteria bacterium]